MFALFIMLFLCFNISELALNDTRVVLKIIESVQTIGGFPLHIGGFDLNTTGIVVNAT